VGLGLNQEFVVGLMSSSVCQDAHRTELTHASGLPITLCW
jgi:hypothetical protein